MTRQCSGEFFRCCFCSLAKGLKHAPVNSRDSPVGCSREEYFTLWSLFSVLDCSGLPEAGRILSIKRIVSFRPAELKVYNISRKKLQPSDRADSMF